MVNSMLESLERLAMPDDLHVKECERLGISNSYDYDLCPECMQKLIDFLNMR